MMNKMKHIKKYNTFINENVLPKYENYDWSKTIDDMLENISKIKILKNNNAEYDSGFLIDFKYGNELFYIYDDYDSNHHFGITDDRNTSMYIIQKNMTKRNKKFFKLKDKLIEKILNNYTEYKEIYKEDIIKRQFNCKATGFWVNKSKEANFLLIMHEHLFVFQK